MLAEIRELIELMSFINDNDEILELNLKFLNGELSYICNDGVDIEVRTLDCKEDIKDIISTLDFRKACISPLEDNFEKIDEYEEEHIQDAYNV